MVEYKTLAYSDALDVDDTIKIVKELGKIISNIFEGSGTSTLDLINSYLNIINKIIEKIRKSEIVNYNLPKQIVLTGD